VGDLTRDQRRDLRLIGLFRSVSLAGDAIAMITILLRFAPHASGYAVGAVTMAGMIPPVILAPLSGVVADRVSAKKFLPLVCLIEATIALSLGFVTGTLGTILLMGALGCGVAFSGTGYSALVPSLVGVENMNLAQSTLQSFQGVAGIAGPLLGGVLVAATGQRWPLFIDAISFVLCALGTLALRGNRVPEPPSKAERRGQFTAGFLWLFRDPVLSIIVINTIFFVLAIGVVNICQIFFTVRVLHATSFEFGLFDAVYAVGNIAGALLGRRVPANDLGRSKWFFIAAGILGGMFFLIGLSSNIWLAMFLMTLAGGANGLLSVAAMTMIYSRSPADILGRVSAALNASVTTTSLVSMALGGLLLNIFSSRSIFQAGGGISLLVVLILGPIGLRRISRGAVAEN
jgi:MFS family permease